jgi:hypothetical protein
MRYVFLLIGILFALRNSVEAAEEYTISGAFNGCSYGKLYELEGGGILECREYNYFYEYRPSIIARGRNVIVIGDEKVEAYIHNGSVSDTKISDDFDGCEDGKVYNLDNGLIFQCKTNRYHYAYRPDVKIFFVEGQNPVILIDGETYDGEIFRR